MGTDPIRGGQPAPTGPVGGRVVLRYRAGEDEGRALYSDVLGVLIDIQDPVRVRREDGEIVAVPRADIHRIKQIPTRPTRRADPLELEEIAAAGWLAPDSQWLGRWWLRAAQGWTQRANSVLPLGDPGLPLPAALAHVTRWYAGRGLPVRFQVPLPGADELDAELDRAGLAAASPTLVQTASLSAFAAEPEIAVTLEPTPSAGWLAAYHYRGAELPAIAGTVLLGAQQPIFASVIEGAEQVAIARAVVDSGWLGVTALEVAESHRRRGLARQVMRALATWGAAQGARQAYLQVAQENDAALALYERLGFRTHHRYHYRIAAAIDSSSST